MTKLLVVEDEANVASFLRKGLQAEGYAVGHVDTGTEALARAQDRSLDLVILDLILPDADGLEVLRSLRQFGIDVPVIILTGHDEVGLRVQALDLGADDYLAKPFAFDELLARIRARLRHHRGRVLRAGSIEMDAQRRQAKVDGSAIDLSSREWALLETFVRRPGHVFSRQQLLSAVWNFDFDPGSNLVEVYVGYLRRKLGKRRIETVRGVGYRLVPGDPGSDR